MWRLFTKPLDVSPDALLVILDDSGQRYIDKAYRDMGVREGWLKKTGYLFDYRGRFTFTYKHIARPRNPRLP